MSQQWEVYLYGSSRFKLDDQCREVFLYGDSHFKLTDKCRSEMWEVYLTATFLFGGPWSCGSVAQGCASALVSPYLDYGSHHL